MRRWALPIGFLLLGSLFLLPTAMVVWRVYADGHHISVDGLFFAVLRTLIGLVAVGFGTSRLIGNGVAAPAHSGNGGTVTRSFIDRVVANFPDAPPVEGNVATGYEASWAGNGLSAGIRTYAKRTSVFLGDSEAEVATVSQAIELLRGIFADRYVAVATYKNDALLKCYIAPAEDIGAGLNSSTHVYQGPLATPADELRVRSWSGTLDAN